jgi:Tfp pilus assembly protein PilO
MRKLNKREYIILAICVSLVLAYIGYQYYKNSSEESGSGIKGEIQIAQRKLAKNQSTIARGPGLNQQYLQLVKVLGTSKSEGVELSAMISKLEALARESNMHVANVQPQRTVTKDIVRIFSVELVVDGKWSSIAKFLYLAQSQPNFLNVEELNMEKYSDITSSLRGRIVLSRTRVIPQN